jgi:general secretion pathway protein I
MSMRHSNKGFTLLEVMVALAIIATVLVALLGTHLMSMNLAHKNKEQALTAMLARQKMEELFTVPFESLAGASGDFGPDYPEYAWEVFVEEAETDNLKNVKITVSSPENSFALETSIANMAVK